MKLDAGLITSLPASDPGSAAVWGSKRINPRPQFCLCLAWSGCPSNDDDNEWWIGLVIKINYHENDLQINFLHPCGPSKYFYWPSHKDVCWVPLSHILCKIHQPKLASAAAAIRSASLKYVILKSEQRHIRTCYESFKF